MTHVVLIALVLAASGLAHAEDAKLEPFPRMAPIEQYRIPNRDDEIALARSAAPPSISADAEVLVLGNRGFEIAVTGKNGSFDLRNLPPGTYTIKAWHEKLGTSTQKITVSANENKEITFVFKVHAGT